MIKIFELLNLENKETNNLFKAIALEVYEPSPHKFVANFWQKYEESVNRVSNNSLKNRNGYFFELLIKFILCDNKIFPFYTQAKVAFVSNVNFDILLFTQEIGVIVLSIKTSLRERYKQADLEAIALKNAHRKSKTFLLTLSEEYLSINKKIQNGDVIGLEKAINCKNIEFDKLIQELKQYTLIKSSKIEIVIGNLIE